MPINASSSPAASVLASGTLHSGDRLRGASDDRLMCHHDVQLMRRRRVAHEQTRERHENRSCADAWDVGRGDKRGRACKKKRRLLDSTSNCSGF